MNQIVNEDVKEQKQIRIKILSEEEERHLFDEARVHTTEKARVHSKQEMHTHSEEETVSRRKKMKVVELASIAHQGKVLKMLGEVGAV